MKYLLPALILFLLSMTIGYLHVGVIFTHYQNHLRPG